MRNKSCIKKTLVYSLSVSFLLLTTGFHQWMAEGKEVSSFIGGMVSKGEVKFEEGREGWQNPEPSYFPISKGTKIRTEKGLALVTLTNRARIELGQNSMLLFAQDDRLTLMKGSMNFWIPSNVAVELEVGNLSVTPTRTSQAAKGVMSDRSQDGGVAGSIFIHPNGQVTVRSIQGNLTVLNKESQTLAALSSRDSVTIPSTRTDAVQVAQADEEAISKKPEEKGVSTWTWVGIAAAVVAVGVGVGLGAGGGGGGGGGPVCP